MAGGDEELEGLRLSALLQRARDSGASQVSLDALMDSEDPRAAVLELVRRRAGRTRVPPLFDATRVGETPVPPDGWVAPFAAEGYVVFPGVLSDQACDQLVEELSRSTPDEAPLGRVGEAILECTFVQALAREVLGEQYEFCHSTCHGAAVAAAFLPPHGRRSVDGGDRGAATDRETMLQQEHWQPRGDPPWCEGGFSHAMAYLRIVILPSGCPREAGLCIVPGSHRVSAARLADHEGMADLKPVAADENSGAQAVLRSVYRLPARDLYLPSKTIVVIDGRTWRGGSSEAVAVATGAAAPGLGIAFKLPSPPHPSTSVLPAEWRHEAAQAGVADSYRRMLFARRAHTDSRGLVTKL
jgi:hypothetical protein